MTPTTAAERLELDGLLIGTKPAATELLFTAARNLRDSSLYRDGSPWIERKGVQLRREAGAILRRLLGIEQRLADTTRQLDALRGVVAELIALADYGDELTAGDIRQLLAAVGIDLDAAAAEAYALRMADATGGAW